MLLSKKVKGIACIVSLFLGGVGCSNAQTPTYSCPEAFIVGDKSYPLDNASLFDGPIEKLGELVPKITENTSVWEVDSKMDPYFVCRFSNVKHTVTFHAVGVKKCTVDENPFKAQCN